MISVKIDNRKASAVPRWPLTSGSVGMIAEFSFSEEWDDLTKTAVFKGSGTEVDQVISGNSCVVPHEVLANAGGDLWIGVYGANGSSTIVIPTVWADAGYIYEGTERSEVDPSDPTPSWADEVQAIAEALDVSVSKSGSTATITVTKYDPDTDTTVTETATVSDGSDGSTGPQGPEGPEGPAGADGSQFWSTTTAPTSSLGQYKFAISSLSGNATAPAVGDIIFYDVYYYVVSTVDTSYAYALLRVSIKGASGSAGAAGSKFYSSANAPTYSAGTYQFDRSDLSPSSGTPKAGDLIFYDVYYYVVTTYVNPVVTASPRVSIKGNTGAAGQGVPASGTTGQVLKKKSGTDYDTEWANESGGGATPYTSNPAALGTASPGSSDDYSRGDHVHPKPSASDIGAIAAPASPNAGDVLTYSSGAWAAQAPASVPSAYTSTPAALGTASAGSSANYARGDHVHAKPTAADIGAISAPGSPSSGDVLTYSGSAWAASVPHYVPSGGNAGAVLAKNSATDYDFNWRTVYDFTPAGLCWTAAGTAAKVAVYTYWDDTAYPQVLYITIAVANTSASALTLNVNGKGAKPIYINGTASSSSNYTLPAGSYVVYYDGTNFYFDTTGKIPADITGHASGDIAAPASPTTGDFLCWNGSAWAATSLSSWQGGNY